MNALTPASRRSVGFSPRSDALPVIGDLSAPDADAAAITEAMIRDVVTEFYRRARQDDHLGPVFAQRVHDWDTHLTRMTDFWSSVLLRTGRYDGRPMERHRAIDELSAGHFGRWIELFETVVRDLCAPKEAKAFLVRAQRMRDGMIKILGLDGGLGGR